MARKRKRMPATVRVSGINISLIVQPPSALNSTAMGCNQTWHSRITLDGELSDDQRKATALHELTHAISNIAGSRMEEDQVVTFSSALFAVIRDNPDFFAWLQDESR